MTLDSQELKFYILKRRVPPPDSESLLGRVVSHFLNPTHDFTPDSPAAALTPSVLNKFLLEEQVDYDAQITTSATKDSSFWAKVKDVLSATAESSQSRSCELTARTILVRGLKQESSYFAALRAIPEVYNRMLEMCGRGGKAYLIVGTMSARTANIKATSNQAAKVAGVGSVPVGILPAVAGGAPLATGIGNVEVGVERASAMEWSVNYSVKDDTLEVIAIACREVTRDWQGLGNDIKMRSRQPEYRGGRHFGNDDSESDEEDEDGLRLSGGQVQLDTDSISFAFSPLRSSKS